MLITIEGIDQSGKATLATGLGRRMEAHRLGVCRLAFPDYQTQVGQLIGAMLHGKIPHDSELMQLLCAANRFEKRDELAGARTGGRIVICDRYTASALAYGKANGVSTDWLHAVESPLPAPDATILLDVDPEAAHRRKTSDRDRYERDTDLLARVRREYRRLAAAQDWIVIDGRQDADTVGDTAWTRLEPLLERARGARQTETDEPDAAGDEQP